MRTVLAIDDEEHILELIAYNLESNGYTVIKADSGEEALKVLENSKPDIILLDYMLPGIDGIEVLKQIRGNALLKKIPVIMLTAKNDEISRVIGLELGADDYLGKPFGVHELLARMKAVLRRTDTVPVEAVDEDVIVIDDIVINQSKRIVTVYGKEIELSKKEFELLYLLAKNKGRVFSREHLLESIWGYDYYGETRTVDVHIRNLRKKIEEDCDHPKYIKTARGFGYKFT